MIRRTSAGILTTIALAALTLSAVPAVAAPRRTHVHGSAFASVVVSETARNAIVVSINGSTMPPQMLKAGNIAPLSIVVTDINHDVLELTALYPHNRLVVWLSYGQQRFARLHSQLRSRITTVAAGPHRLRFRLSPLQRVLKLSAGDRARRSAPTTQATSSGSIGLTDRPLTETAAASQTVLLCSSEHIPPIDRAGPPGSRAPPRFAII